MTRNCNQSKVFLEQFNSFDCTMLAETWAIPNTSVFNISGK